MSTLKLNRSNAPSKYNEENYLEMTEQARERGRGEKEADKSYFQQCTVTRRRGLFDNPRWTTLSDLRIVVGHLKRPTLQSILQKQKYINRRIVVEFPSGLCPK